MNAETTPEEIARIKHILAAPHDVGQEEVREIMNSYPPFPPPSVNPWDSQDPWFIHHREGEFPGYTFDEFLGHWVLAYPLEDDYNDVDPVFPALARTLERMIDNGVWGPRPGTEEESDPGTEEEWEHAPPIVESFAHDEPTVLSDPSSEDGERVREPGVTYADDPDYQDQMRIHLHEMWKKRQVYLAGLKKVKGDRWLLEQYSSERAKRLKREKIAGRKRFFSTEHRLGSEPEQPPVDLSLIHISEPTRPY